MNRERRIEGKEVVRRATYSGLELGVKENENETRLMFYRKGGLHEGKKRDKGNAIVN